MTNKLSRLNVFFLSVVVVGTVAIFALLFATTKSQVRFRFFPFPQEEYEILLSNKYHAPVDIKFLTDDFLHNNNHNGSYPSWLPCPYSQLRKAPTGKPTPTTKPATAECVLHQSSHGACNDAANYFGKPNDKLLERKCDEASYPDICKFTTGNSSGIMLTCNEDVCKGKDVYVGAINMKIGVITNWEPMKPFSISNMKTFVESKIKENHNFCFIKCGGVFQALAFPPKIIFNKKSDPRKQINIVMVVLDSISRRHFYRMMRDSVDAMRKVIYDDSIKATVLDFELFQSISMHTFDNIRPLFSGIYEGNKDFSKSSKSLSPLGIHVLNTAFKQHGYQTMFQEDICWHDSWGIMLNDLEQSGSAITAERWTRFQKLVSKHNVDHFGLTHFSCEVIKKYGLTNHYDRPSQVCLNGKFYNVYFLKYIESIINEIGNANNSAPLLLYQHINSGHTDTGSRIRNDDRGLAEFILNMARDPNTLTVILSDHGHTRTGYGQTEEGKRELYHPHLFMIVPHYVAGLLGKQRMEALVVNQKRLFTTLDIHKALITLYDEKKKHSTDYKVSGIFSKIPVNRTCADVPIMPLARCQCEGNEEKFSNNAKNHRWVAEFALGQLNNIIQKQYSNGIDKSSTVRRGYGNCVRLLGSSFRDIIRSNAGKLITMDLYTNSKNIGLKEDEVYRVAVEMGDGTLSLKTYSRQTLYNKFTSCVDKTVDIKICACDRTRPSNTSAHVRVLSSKDMKALVASPIFDSEATVKDLHGGCLFQITRQHSSRFSISYEVANSCEGKNFKISVSGSVYYIILSRSLPFDLVAETNSVYFLFSAARQILNHSHMEITVLATKV